MPEGQTTIYASITGRSSSSATRPVTIVWSDRGVEGSGDGADTGVDEPEQANPAKHALAKNQHCCASHFATAADDRVA